MRLHLRRPWLVPAWECMKALGVVILLISGLVVGSSLAPGLPGTSQARPHPYLSQGSAPESYGTKSLGQALAPAPGMGPGIGAIGASPEGLSLTQGLVTPPPVGGDESPAPGAGLSLHLPNDVSAVDPPDVQVAVTPGGYRVVRGWNSESPPQDSIDSTANNFEPSDSGQSAAPNRLAFLPHEDSTNRTSLALASSGARVADSSTPQRAPNNLRPLGGFSTGLDIGASGISNGVPGAYLWDTPSEMVDTFGDVYVEFVANAAAGACFSGSTAGWAVYYAVSINGGTSFFTKCEIAPGAGLANLNPSIAITPTGSDVCLVASAYATSSTTEQGDYYFLCTTSGVTALHAGTATWGSLYDGELYDGMCGASHGASASEGDAVATFDSSGNLLVGIWGYQYSACSTFGIGVDVWTSPATSTTHTTYFIPDSTLSGPIGGTGGYYYANLWLACDSSAAVCSIFFAHSNYAGGAYNTWYSLYFTSTNDFSTYTTPVILSRHAWTSTAFVTDYVDIGGAQYASSGSDSAVAFLHDTVVGTASVSYGLNYSYSSNDFTTLTAGSSPKPGGTGYYGMSLALEGSGAIPFVSFNDANYQYLTAATSQSGSFSTKDQALSPGTDGGMLGVYSGSTWEVDVAWTTSQTTTQTYFSSLYQVSIGSGSTSPTTIDVNQGVAFGATASNGVTPLTFSYGGLPAGCSSTNSSSLSCSPTVAGTYAAIVLTVSDLWGFTASVTLPTLTVNPALVAGSITPASAFIDNGQAITLSSSVATGGTPAYSYQWYSGSSTTCSSNSIISGQTTTSYTPSPTSTTYYCVKYGDSSTGLPTAAAYSNVVLVTVYTALSAGAVTPGSPGIDSGQAITLSSNEGNGVPTFSYLWYTSTSGIGACSTGTSTAVTTSTYTASPTVNTYFCYQVTDSSSGNSGHESVGSAWDLVTVDIALSAGPVTPGAPGIDNGQAITLTSHEGNGVPVISYLWYASSTGTGACNAGTSTGITTSTYTPSPTLTTYYCYQATDSSAGNSGPENQGSTWDEVFVYTALTANAVTGSAATIDVGQSDTLSSHEANGVPTFAYAWYSSSSGTGACNSGVSTGGVAVTYLVSPTLTTYYCYQVTDSSSGNSGTESAGSPWYLLTVYPDPTLTAVSESSPVSCSSGCSSDQGQTLSVATTASAGSGGYVFTWAITAGASYCSGSASGTTTSTYSCTVGTITVTTTWTITVYVTDSNGCKAPTPCAGGTLSTSVSLEVDPSITSITGSPLSGGVEAGQSLTLTGVPSGGSGTYTAWSWTSLPTGCTNTPAASLTCTPTVGGAYTITVQADDTNNYGPISRSVNFIIQPAGSMIPSTRTPLTPIRAGIPGATASFNTSATGGTGNYTLYTWTESSSNLGCVLANSVVIYCSPLTPGNYTVSVTVTDSDNATSRVRTSQNWEVNGTLYPGFVTVTANVIDLGQTVGLQTSSPYGGSPAYTYAWRSGPSTTCANDPLISGAYFPVHTASPVSSSFYCVSYGDNSSGTPPPVVYSNVVLIAVNPLLVAGSSTPATPAVDLGQSLVLSSGASGGTSPYAFAWYSSVSGTGPCDSGTFLSTSSSLALSPSGSSYYCYVVTDSSGGSPTAVASSAWDLVTVDPALVAGPISPQSVILDQGQSATLDSNPGGGTTPYAVTWFSSSTGSGTCTAGAWVAASLSVLVSPSTSGYYCYELTDGSQGTPAADSLSGWVLVAVSPALVAGFPSPSSATLDVGQTLTLTSSSPSGGSPGYSYQWYSGPASSCSSDSPILGQTQVSLTVLPSASTYYCVEYGDSSMGTPVVALYSTTVPVAVNPALVAGAPSPATVSTDLGLSLSLSASASGGTPGYSYQWYSSPAPGTCTGTDSAISGATSSSFTTLPSLPMGTHFFCYAVADSSDAAPMAVFSSTAAVSIYPDPVLSVITQVGPTPCTSGCVADASQILSVSTTASLGSGGYIFSWQITSGGSTCAGSATGSSISVYSCRVGALSHSQIWMIAVSVTDSLGCAYPSPCGGGSSLAFSVTLYPDPSLTSPVQNSPVLCAIRCSADQGQTLAIETTASGGSGAYSFTWTVTRGAAMCSGQGTGAPVSIYACTVGVVSAPQNWEVSVVVTDLSGCSIPEACAGGKPLTFNLTLEPDPTVSISASPVSGSAGPGEMLIFTASANGGSVSYVGWTWSSLPPGCASSGVAVDSCLASAGGVYTVAVSVRDSDGFGPFNASVSYIVAPTTPAPSVGVPVAGSVSGEVGVSVSFSTNASGGSGSYSSYSWSESASGFGCALSFASTISCVPLIAGSFTVSVYVVDSLGHSSHSRTSATFSVASNPALPTISLSASRSTVPVSETVLLTASITGGITPYSVQWFLNGGVIPGVSGGAYSFAPSSPGTFDFYVVITDGSGARVMSAPLEIQSVAAPTSPHLSFVQTSDGMWTWVVAGLSTVLLLEFALWDLVVQRRSTPSASDEPRAPLTVQNGAGEGEGDGPPGTAREGEQ